LYCRFVKKCYIIWDMAVTRSATRAAASRELGEVLRHLHQIQSAVVVAVAALRYQNCELDADISNLLQRSVADRIQDQIDRLELLSQTSRRTQ
jgi:aminoglycoside phosphotransferase (APT) family kinase protein